MTHEVIIKQIHEIRNPKNRMLATVDVKVGDIVVKGFKIFRNDQNALWTVNPQSEVNGTYYEILEFLDWELEQAVKEKILTSYQKLIQSRTVIPETTE